MLRWTVLPSSHHLIKRIAPIPIPVYALIVAVLYVSLPATVLAGMAYNPAWLLLVLQTVFIFGSSVTVSYISLRSYLTSGSRGILLLGCGTLTWGLANLFAAFLYSPPGGPNVVVSIASVGGLTASIFHIASAASTSKGASSDTRLLRSKLLVAYSGVISFVVLFTVLAIYGVTPAFFVPGSGTTILRQTVVLAAVSLFSLASIIMAKLYHGSRSGILFWYSMALALTAVGIGASFFGRVVGDPIAWTSRTAIYLGGVYFLSTVWSAFRPGHDQAGKS